MTGQPGDTSAGTSATPIPQQPDSLGNPAPVAQAQDHGEVSALQPADIRHGGYYCNGAFGPHWQVRQVIAGTDADARLSYRVVAGTGRRRSGTSSRAAFAHWARYEVARNENSWQRVGTSRPGPAVTGNVA